MTEIKASFTNDGEWINLSTSHYSGPLEAFTSEGFDVTSVLDPESTPAVQEGTIDLDEGQTWLPVSSAHGAFEIYAPSYNPLQDWSMELFGLPRVYGDINTGRLSDIFGKESVGVLDQIYERTNPRHESIGDLRARQRTQGLVNANEEQTKLSRINIEAPYDLNEVSRQSRLELMMRAKVTAGRFVVARTVLFD